MLSIFLADYMRLFSVFGYCLDSARCRLFPEPLPCPGCDGGWGRGYLFALRQAINTLLQSTQRRRTLCLVSRVAGMFETPLCDVRA